MTPNRSCQSECAFTLVELLTVIAIIAVLAGILIPTTRSARTAANRARVRIQFSQWAAALETFRQEYGVYPVNLTGGTLLNQGATNDPGGSHPFHDVLVGRRRDGTALPESESAENSAAGQNPHCFRFLTFAEADFVRADDVDAARNQPGELNYVRDAFHNTSIALIVDTNLDGVINAADLAGDLPAVLAAGGTTAIRPNRDNLLGPGIQAGVLFYSAPPGSADERDLIRSWK